MTYLKPLYQIGRPRAAPASFLSWCFTQRSLGQVAREGAEWSEI